MHLENLSSEDPAGRGRVASRTLPLVRSVSPSRAGESNTLVESIVAMAGGSPDYRLRHTQTIGSLLLPSMQRPAYLLALRPPRSGPHGAEDAAGRDSPWALRPWRSRRVVAPTFDGSGCCCLTRRLDIELVGV